jgi:Retrotransposon gag protein
MEPSISDVMSYQNSTQAMWEKTESLFSKKINYAHIYQLQQEIQQLKQSSESITEIYSKLQKKIEEIKMYRPPTSDPTEIQLREQQDDIFQFLAILDSNYEAVRSQILLMANLPSVDEVVAMVEREETQ